MVYTVVNRHSNLCALIIYFLLKTVYGYHENVLKRLTIDWEQWTNEHIHNSVMCLEICVVILGLGLH